MQSSSIHGSRQARKPGRGLAAGLALASLVLVENPASAQPSQPAQAAAVCRIEETMERKAPLKVHLKEGDQSIETYYTFGSDAKPGEQRPVVKCSGPAKVTVEFYPLIDEKWNGTRRPITYELDGKKFTEYFNVRISGLDVVEKKLFGFPNYIRVAQPVKLELEIGAGEHGILLHPPGYIRQPRVVKVEQRVKPPQPPFESKQPQSRQQTETKKEPKARFPVSFGVSSEMVQFDGPANKPNRGTIAETSLTASVDLTRRLSLVLSPRFDYYSLTGTPSGTRSDFTLYSAGASAGAGLSLGNHSVTGLFTLTADMIRPTVGTAGANNDNRVGFGGELNYSYKRLFMLGIRGSTNPANPLTLRASAGIPYSWVRDAYPRLDIEARWLHTFSDGQIDNGVLSAPLDSNDIFARVTAGIPVVGIPFGKSSGGPFVPFLLAGVELDKSGYNGTFVGAMLSRKSRFWSGTYLGELGGTVTVDRRYSRLMLLLNLTRLHE